jgi:hypothetical protein
MNRKKNARHFSISLRPSFIAFALVVIVVCPTAESAMPPQPTVLRGCLRTIGKQTFILIAQDRLGYMLDGDRDVFSHHTDQEVEIAGTALEPTRDDGAPASWLLKQTQKPDQKNTTPISIPGLRIVRVSSLTPLSGQCPAVVATR